MKGSNIGCKLSVRAILIGSSVSLLIILLGLGITTICIDGGNTLFLDSFYFWASLQMLSALIGSIIAGVVGKENQTEHCIFAIVPIVAIEVFLGCILFERFPVKILIQCVAGLLGSVIAAIILTKKNTRGNNKRIRSTRRFVQNTQRGKFNLPRRL